MINDYVTVYRKDYVPKKVKTNRKALNDLNRVKNKEFSDPINESFKKFLCVKKCEDEYSEELDTYFDKAVEKYPGFKFFLNNESINKNTIKKGQIYDGRTEYQVIYCDLEKEVADKKYQRQHAIVLPNDSYIPLTTQTASYRRPISINSKAYHRIKTPKPENNLDPQHNIRKILNVTTGATEYMGIIGRLGDRIVLEELHGHIPLL